MTTKDYILFVSIIINLILGYWIYDGLHPDENKIIKELEQSKAREYLHAQRDSLLTIQLDSIKKENKLKDSLLSLHPKQVIIIKKYFDEERNRVFSLSYDSSLMYVSERLQGVSIK